MPLNDPWLPDDPGPVNPVVPWYVYKVPSGSGVQPEPVYFPNVQCRRITRAINGEAGYADFRLVLGNQAPPGAPSTWEQALGSNVTLPLSVEVGDRFIVQATQPGGAQLTETIFDGKILAGSLKTDGANEAVEFRCVGVGWTLRYNPIPGAIYRQATTPIAPNNDIQTGLRTHFNPKGIGNRVGGQGTTDKSAYSTYNGDTCPVFIDQNVSYGTGNFQNPTFWNLPDAVRYILFTNNDGSIVTNPIGDDLDALLVSYEPADGSEVVDVNDPNTYTTSPIVVADKPVDSKDIVGAVTELVADKGFNTRFIINNYQGGTWANYFDIYLPQREPVLDVWLQPRGSSLDLNYSNMQGAAITRDFSEAINVWSVEGALTQYEVSFLLTPGFPVVAADATSPETYNSSDPSYSTTNYDKYRYFIFDECGLGHWPNTPGAAKAFTIASLDTVLGKPINGTPQYVARLRKPIGQLITKDSHGKPLRATLSYTSSSGVVGTGPFVWDVNENASSLAATWQPVLSGWELLPDRIGIRVTCDNPNAWHVGKAASSVQPVVLKLVEALATPSTQNPAITFRLTVVIEADQPVRGLVLRNSNAALTENVKRIVDARDRYKQQYVMNGSENNTSANRLTVRDDTADAYAEAVALQLASSGGILSGPIRIPYFTNSYKLGNRVGSVQGRDISFRTDNGETGTPPTYPSIESITHDRTSGGDWTIIHTSDASSARHGYRGSRQLHRRK